MAVKILLKIPFYQGKRRKQYSETKRTIEYDEDDKEDKATYHLSYVIVQSC